MKFILYRSKFFMEKNAKNLGKKQKKGKKLEKRKKMEKIGKMEKNWKNYGKIDNP